MLVGRIDPVRGITPDIDLSPYDLPGKISRRHALITWTGKEFLFEDLGSANGSRINGIAMTPRQPQRLQLGDELRLGELLLRFSIASRSHPSNTYNNL
jgi:pSer/pThr/pTyr-binding forkhead associated (FHA) protein